MVIRMSFNGKSKLIDWFSVAKCIRALFVTWNGEPCLVGELSYSGLISKKRIRQSICSESRIGTGIRQMTLEEVFNGR